MKKNKEKKTGIILMAIFISLLMILSIFGIVLDNITSSDNFEYGKQKFTQTENGYSTKINNKQMSFYYFPSEIEHINISEDIINKLNNAQLVVFLFNPNAANEQLQYVDAARFDLEQQSNIPIYSGITESSELYPTLPVLSCENASVQTPFIILNISSSAGFAADETNPDCIIMNARLKDIIILQERLIYGLYGIIPIDE